jgi:hypothetical protein
MHQVDFYVSIYSYQQPSMPTSAPTDDTMTLSGLSALGSTLVNPQEEILEEEHDIAPV